MGTFPARQRANETDPQPRFGTATDGAAAKAVEIDAEPAVCHLLGSQTIRLEQMPHESRRHEHLVQQAHPLTDEIAPLRQCTHPGERRNIAGHYGAAGTYCTGQQTVRH